MRVRGKGRFAAIGFASVVMLVAACFSGSGPPLVIPAYDASPPPVTLVTDAGNPLLMDVDLGDPFQLDGLVPSHGPFSGGTRTTLNGRGFPSTLRVSFGATEIDPSAIFASSPTRAAIVTPPGPPGPVDVTIRDDATAETRTLAAGFVYDAFVVAPASGATSGGTRVAITGSGTSWTSATTVTFGTSPCTAVSVTDATHLHCTTPANAEGSVDVTVTNADASFVHASDAYTYSDSPDGYRGGLAGGALDGTINVLAFDSYTGNAIAGAYAIAGAFQAQTNSEGVAAISDPSLASPVTVTIAAKCHQPTTFVNVPVDTVTAYLDPTLDPSCGMGDPPSTGNGYGPSAGAVAGELVWTSNVDYVKSPWTTVPQPIGPNERQAAYVFMASESSLANFYLPPASQAITPTTDGVYGYAYTVAASPGNVTLYALAGIEDRSVSPPLFTAYVMGVARGVSVQPNGMTAAVDLPMTSILDHAVTLNASPPAPTSRGPDRLFTELAITVGDDLFAILPVSAQTHLLPLGGPVTFSGVPALDNGLAGESYTIGASAATGAQLENPASVVANVETTDSNDPVTLGGFLAVPTFIEPANGAWGGTHVSFGASGAFDLSTITISSGDGLVTWSIVAPSGVTSFDLPDLSALPDSVGLIPGPIQTELYVARLDGFDYASVVYGQLGTNAWNAYAFDVANGAY